MVNKARDFGAHPSHCCAYHGCKYGDEDCPVATGKVAQDHKCEEYQPDYGLDTHCFPLLAGEPGNLRAARNGIVTVLLDDGVRHAVSVTAGDSIGAIADMVTAAVYGLAPRGRQTP